MTILAFLLISIQHVVYQCGGCGEQWYVHEAGYSLTDIYSFVCLCFHDSSGSVETFLVLVSLSCSILVFLFFYSQFERVSAMNGTPSWLFTIEC